MVWRRRPCGRQLLQPRQALREAFARDVLEVLVEREAVGHAERRQVVLPLRDRDVAALGDQQRVREALRGSPLKTAAICSAVFRKN